jgi:putative transposase
VPKLAAIMDDAEPDVLAYMTLPKEHPAKLHSTDEIDKRFLRGRGILRQRGRPRGEARRTG